MGSLIEIRPGRRIWVEVGKASTDAHGHASHTVAILVHGSCARSEQVQCSIA